MERVLESPRRHRRECVGTIDRTRNWTWKAYRSLQGENEMHIDTV